MKVDLHMHSDASDGVLSSHALLARAREQGVSCLSITDHDSLAAYQSWPSWDLTGLFVVPGVEFSTVWQGLSIHVLAYAFRLGHPAIIKLVDYQSRMRAERVITIAGRLSKVGVPGALEWLQQRYALGEPDALSQGRTYIGRPHFARFLVEIGAVSNMQQAFKKYLGAGKAGDVKQDWAELSEIIGTVRQAQGWAVLAHPAKYKLTNTKLRRLIHDFANMGGRGLEVVSGRQLTEQSQYLAKLANEAGLLASSGSDFHEPGKVWAELGRQSPLPAECEPLWLQWQPQRHGLGGLYTCGPN